MDDIYNAAIMAQARAAIGDGRLAKPDATLTLDNPLCGDRVTLDIRIEAGRITALGHKVRGCALCEAAASVIGARALGATPSQAKRTISAIRALLGDGQPGNGEAWTEIGIFAPVRGVKSRHDCVLLPFETLERVLTAAGQ